MYTHNYEKLTYKEAEGIIAGTFTQGSESIPGECVTRSQVSYMCTQADKTMLNPVPEDGDTDELICWFDTKTNRIDPTSIQVEDITIYVGQSRTEIEYTLYPSGAEFSDEQKGQIKYTFGEGYQDYITPEWTGSNTVYVSGKKRTGDENKIPYSITCGSIVSNTAYITVKDQKDQQQDMLNAGNIVTLVYNINKLNKKAGDYITVYNSGYTNPQYSSRVDYIWAVSKEGVTQDDINPFNLPIKDITGKVRKDDQFWVTAITDDMIVDNNKVVLYLQFPKSETSIPEEIELDNPDIEKIYIPAPYKKLDRSILFRNESLETVIIDSSINEFVQNCLSYIPSLKDIYIGSDKAPSLTQTYYPGFTFVATDQGKRGNTASNVSIHIPSTATGYDASETDVWSWPGCFKAKEGNNEVRYGNYKNQTLKLQDYTKDLEALNTWQLVKDYDSKNVLYILYDRDPETGAKKLQS